MAIKKKEEEQPESAASFGQKTLGANVQFGMTQTGVDKPEPQVTRVEPITGATTTEPAREQGEGFARLSKQEEQDIARIEMESRGLETAAQAVETRRAELAQQAQLQAQQEAILEQAPTRQELTPAAEELTFFDKLAETPVVGGSVTSGKTLGRFLKNKLGIDSAKGYAAIPISEQPTVAMMAIQEEEIERGLTASETFGSIVEGIPVVGSLAGKYAGGLIETPSENAKEVLSNVRKEKRRLSNIETNVRSGYLPVEEAQRQIQDIENNVLRLESRLKLLVNNSPELKYNSDYVNTMETEILQTREEILQSKLNVLQGATQDPTELMLLQKLAELDSDSEDIELEE